ncbi:MAG TPA: TonB-dependent receptor [Steroidobacteraceae bacterium]
MIHSSAVRGPKSSVAAAVHRALGTTGTTLLILAASLAAGTAGAQQATPAAAPADGQAVLQEVTVTGSRIQRADGYEAPTPVSVLGADDLNKMATSTIADSVNRLPAFAGSQTPRNRSSNISSGTAGTNLLNLRGLGANRTLVLQDGKRMVGSSIATGSLSGAVDVNMIPSGLVQRVDVVTGGASAVYGSDALAGVVNFILDKDFTGVKGNVDGGITSAGDGENYKISLTAGTAFAGGRGHLLFSGEYADDQGIIGNDRSWADDSFQMMANPNKAQPGQSTLLTVHNAGVANGTFGGLTLSCQAITPYVDIVKGPSIKLAPKAGACGLRGIQFGQGGVAMPFQFGNPLSGPTMSGGDSEDSRIDRATSVGLPLERHTLFGRASYDITDNVNGYVELQYGKTSSQNEQVVPILNNGGSVFVYQDNAFLSPAIKNSMVANNVDALEIGTFNGDMHYLQGINEREMKRGVVGFQGNFDLGSRAWKWDASYVYGEQEIESWTPTNRVNANYAEAINAVVDPATGQIVCGTRSANLQTVNVDPACKPYNPMGLGVNSPSSLNYITATGHSDLTLKQEVAAASVSGDMFDNWAGPVSLAAGAEHRKESSEGDVSALDQASAFFAGNYKATVGSYNVTEGFVETVFPLLKDVPGADMLDFNGAVRYTDYSESGGVTTWKAGLVWSPIEDMRFRFTRSRDIRAPGLGELFNQGAGGTGNNTDLGLPGSPSYFMQSQTIGNRNLKPEEADTTGLGVVLTPRFLPGFTMSVDYYDIKVDGTIYVRSSREIIEGCYLNNDQQLCSQIHRNDAGFIDVITSSPENIVGEEASGVDIDATYRLPVGPGDLTLRAMGTIVTKLDTTTAAGKKVDGRGVNSDDAGIGLGANLWGPKYRYLLSAGYDLNPVEVTLTMRGISSGVYNNAFYECQQGSCPTQAELTSMGYSNSINDNHIASAHYFDLGLNYKLEDMGEVYFVVENLTNEDPAKVAGGTGAGFYQGQSNVSLYDRFGTMYHAGVRFKF